MKNEGMSRDAQYSGYGKGKLIKEKSLENTPSSSVHLRTLPLVCSIISLSDVNRYIPAGIVPSSRVKTKDGYD